MATTTLSTIITRLSEQIGDFLEFDTTTNITTNTSIISTTLQNYDSGQDDYFINFWLYITEGNNIAVERQVSDYATATGTLTVRGANLAAEAGAVTCELHRYRRSDKTKSINDAIRETSSTLMKDVENRELIMGNILPPFKWTSTSALYKYSTSNITLAQTTTAGLTRNAESSAKCTAGADNGYTYISSDNYLRLLDLQNHSVTFRCWAYPEVADDAAIVIYTVSRDGTTTQTLTSTTACPAGMWTLLELENQDVNDDLEEIQFRMKVGTNAKYVYFDAPRIDSFGLDEYMLPDEFQTGRVSRVYVQASGEAEEFMCDDRNPRWWDEIFSSSIWNDGTDKYINIPFMSPMRTIKLVGRTPLSTLSTDAGTITIDAENVNALIAYAKYKHFQQFEAPVSSEDVGRYETESAKAYNEYLRLVRKLSSRHKSVSMHLAEI